MIYASSFISHHASITVHSSFTSHESLSFINRHSFSIIHSSFRFHHPQFTIHDSSFMTHDNWNWPMNHNSHLGLERAIGPTYCYKLQQNRLYGQNHNSRRKNRGNLVGWSAWKACPQSDIKGSSFRQDFLDFYAQESGHFSHCALRNVRACDVWGTWPVVDGRREGGKTEESSDYQ